MSYVELHLHSAYSFLDGASMPDEIVPTARELGHHVMALTDHNSLSGSMEFAQAARAHDMRALHGAEIDVVDAAGLAAGARSRHLTLLVRDAAGWRNLCRLLTEAHRDTRQPGRSGWIGEPSVTLEQVAAHAEGLVCLSGCADRGIRDEPTMRFLLDAFGPDAFRVELQRPFARHDRARNRGLEGLARRLGVPCVATGNIHAHTRERARLQDAFVAISEAHHARRLRAAAARQPRACPRLAQGDGRALRGPPRGRAGDRAAGGDAVLRPHAGPRLPLPLRRGGGHRPAPGRAVPGQARGALPTRSSAARRGRGAHRRGAARHPQARPVGLLPPPLGAAGAGPGGGRRGSRRRDRPVAAAARSRRGSSVSSIVCYLTGLSHIDPLTNALALGRFLNEDLVALPDIDLDFPRDVREVLIPRVHERYGRENSALVAAFPTFKARGAIRELGKALGLPPGELERVARGSEGWGAHGVDQDIAVALGEKRAQEGRWRWLAELAAQADGLPRHLSQHSGGMIVATRPLIDCCPVLPAAMEGRQIVQWDKDSCADAGFLKIDLLGLGMLSAVERAVELIARRRHETIDLSRIPFDDKPTYEAIQNAETTGVFQIESRAQMGSLRRTRPENLDDLTIQVAIVRPGPIVGGAVNPYIERKQRMRVDPDFVVPYDHPSLEPALRDTLGTIIFQDQVLEVAQAFAGFSAGQAESLRRAMSRKRSSAAIESHHASFVQGAIARHPDVDESSAENVWKMVVGFAGFGFPKAHGAAFGLLAYQSTWLRVHYGPEFLCALLDEQPMGFYPPDALVHEAQRRGIEILPPDVNASAADCTVTQAGAVRIGLGYVLGVRREEVAALVAEREHGGSYGSIADLAARAGAGRPALEQLAWSGACDRLVGEGRVARRTALWQLGVARPAVPVGQHGTQLGLALDLPAAPSLQPLGDWEALVADYATTGMAIAHHPFALLRPHLARDGIVSSRDLEGLPHGAHLQLAGLVMARQKPGTANGVCFMLLEDEFGTINLIVPPPVYERDRQTVRSEPLVVADGKLERYASAGGAINFVVRRLRPLEVPIAPLAEVRDLPPRAVQPVAADEPALAAAAGAFRAVAPPVQSFARGRSR